jgi:hypothetical protein
LERYWVLQQDRGYSRIKKRIFAEKYWGNSARRIGVGAWNYRADLDVDGKVIVERKVDVCCCRPPRRIRDHPL